MRFWLVAPAFAVVAFAFDGSARAAEDELPTGSEPPTPVLTGVIDAYYAWHDVPPPGRQSTTLSTASRHDEFSVNLGAIGVRLDHAKLTGNLVIQFGDSVEQAYGAQRLRNIQLANVGWKTGIVHLEAGVMPSLVGRESFISTDNWNYTRAFIADATPYYVSGARLTAHVSPTFLVGGTVFTGWQTSRGGTGSPHGQLFTSWKPSDTFSLDGTFLVGRTPVDT
ncbi:MAG: outer membrane beta-barrel protein, partial [Polyangiales bacterium]